MSARRELSKRLGVELSTRYERLVLASGEKAVAEAAVSLGALFNANIETICWVMKAYGGLKDPLPEAMRPVGENAYKGADPLDQEVTVKVALPVNADGTWADIERDTNLPTTPNILLA